jgi:phosphatidylserine synthase
MLVALALLLALAGQCLATVRYVDLNSANPTPPFINWATAATVVQDAVDVADPGDEIVVTNGTYATGGPIVWRWTKRWRCGA